MKNPLQLTAKSYASCAKKAAISAPNPITPDYAELLIGIGTCEDWLRWAFELRTLDFARLPMRRSNRAVSFLESTRFTFARTAANALFSRDAILSRFGSSQLPRVEFDRFTLLCDIANIGVAERDAYLATLHSTLDILRTPDQFPWTSSKHVRIIELIYYKYTPDLYKGMGKAGLAIKNAATGKISTTQLDLPTIIYSTRNWLVHGAVMNTSLRGSAREFNDFISTATYALGHVLLRFAAELEATV